MVFLLVGMPEVYGKGVTLTIVNDDVGFVTTSTKCNSLSLSVFGMLANIALIRLMHKELRADS